MRIFQKTALLRGGGSGGSGGPGGPLGTPALLRTEAFEEGSGTSSWAIFSNLHLAESTMALVIVSAAAAVTFSTSSTGWAVIDQASGGGETLAVFYKVDPTTSETLTVDATGSTRMHARLYEVENADTIAVNVSATAEPGNVTLAASGDALWITSSVSAQTAAAYTAAPSGFEFFKTSAHTNTNGSRIAFAHLDEAAAGSRDPGAFTGGGTVNVSATIGLTASVNDDVKNAPYRVAWYSEDISSDDPVTVSLTSLNDNFDGLGIQEDDLVIVIVTGVAGSDWDFSVTGYTELLDMYQSDSQDSNTEIFYKLQGATPDTSIDVSAVLTAANGSAVLVEVWRNVNQTTPLGTPTTAGGSNSGTANPPSITPTNDYSVVLAVGANTAGGGGWDGSPPLREELLITTGGVAVTLATCWDVWRSGDGAVDPAAFVSSGGSTDSWTAASLIINPV